VSVAERCTHQTRRLVCCQRGVLLDIPGFDCRFTIGQQGLDDAFADITELAITADSRTVRTAAMRAAP